MSHQLLLDTIRVCISNINFIDGYDNWNTCSLCVVNCFNCLRHYSIISSNNKHNHVSYLCSTSTHSSECCMAWSVEENKVPVVRFNIICSNMLCNISRFGIYHIGITNRIKKRCFTMIYMPHNSNNRGTRCQIVRIIFLLYFS